MSLFLWYKKQFGSFIYTKDATKVDIINKINLSIIISMKLFLKDAKKIYEFTV